MRKELPYYEIGDSFGGNQNWFRDPMMKLGGCAAATACDTCINMSLYSSKTDWYPYDIQTLNREDYIRFSKIMKPYLKPRFQGIDTLKLFIEGFYEYLKGVGESNIHLEEFSGDMPAKQAIIEIKNQIDNGIVIPFLLLKHRNVNLKYFTWHWFLIVGYEEFENEFYVKVSTYGQFHWLSFHELWKTEFKRKGGIILIR
ncbi:MAG TPA: hypothetical protein VHQ24_15740 [Lachnospiraceae bacterium]|nr:hypothetical protein [Lachnospiraceae bacterium]